MKKLFLLIGSLLAFALPAFAEAPIGYVTVSASNVQDSTGAPLANGTISFTPVNNSGAPVNYRVNGHGPAISVQVTTLVTNGAFRIQLADTSLTAPANVCYAVTIKNNSNGKQILGPGYNCVQPSGIGVSVTGGNAWCTAATAFDGGTCNFDSYTPNLAALVAVQTGPTGPTGATGQIGSPGGSLSYPGVTSDGANNLVISGNVNSDISGPVVNLLQYAMCDGVTDDMAAIQTALTAAGALVTTHGSATLYVPDGRVCLVGHNPNGATGTILTRPANVNIDGHGTIKIASGLQWQFLMTTTTETGGVIQNVTFDANGAGNTITLAPGNVFQGIIQEIAGNNFTVTNCSFLNVNGVFTVLVNGTGPLGADVSITNNRWLNLGAGATLFYDTSEVRSNAEHTVVSGNIFNTSGNVNGFNTAIEVDGGHSIITGNDIQGLVTGIIHAPGVVGTGTDSIISNNTITAQSEGISFWSAQTSPGLDGLQITHNQIIINRNLETTVGGGEGGIAWFTGSTFPLRDVTISGNNIRWATETSQFPAGIFLSGLSVCLNSAAPTITNIVISANTVDNSPGSGIAFCPGGGTVNGAQITNNVINNPGQDGVAGNDFKVGIFIAGVASYGPGMVVKNNTMIDNQSTATMVDGLEWSGTAGDNANKNAVSIGNTVIFATQPSTPAFAYLTSHPYINERIFNFGSNQNSVLFGAASGNFTPAGSTIFDPSTSTMWTNTAINSEAFAVQQRQQTCTTGIITPSTGTGGIAAANCTIATSATGHTGYAVATDGSVQGNLIPQVSVNGTSVTVTLTNVVGGSGTAKSYNVVIF
jgi:hypothetical protein